MVAHKFWHWHCANYLASKSASIYLIFIENYTFCVSGIIILWNFTTYFMSHSKHCNHQTFSFSLEKPNLLLISILFLFQIAIKQKRGFRPFFLLFISEKNIFGWEKCTLLIYILTLLLNPTIALHLIAEIHEHWAHSFRSYTILPKSVLLTVIIVTSLSCFFFAAEAITQNTNHPKQSITSLLQFKILHFIFKHATLLNLLTYSSWYGVSCFFTDLNSSFILFVLFSHQLTNNITPY